MSIHYISSISTISPKLIRCIHLIVALSISHNPRMLLRSGAGVAGVGRRVLGVAGRCGDPWGVGRAGHRCIGPWARPRWARREWWSWGAGCAGMVGWGGGGQAIRWSWGQWCTKVCWSSLRWYWMMWFALGRDWRRCWHWWWWCGRR